MSVEIQAQLMRLPAMAREQDAMVKTAAAAIARLGRADQVLEGQRAANAVGAAILELDGIARAAVRRGRLIAPGAPWPDGIVGLGLIPVLVIAAAAVAVSVAAFLSVPDWVGAWGNYQIQRERWQRWFDWYQTNQPGTPPPMPPELRSGPTVGEQVAIGAKSIGSLLVLAAGAWLVMQLVGRKR